MKKVAIVQSNYIPWKGYFDLIAAVDDFILFDEVQFTRRDWRNRNQIKTKDGLLWLTIPVQVKGRYFQKISETQINDCNWALEHWKSLTHHYVRAPYFREIANWLEPLYLQELPKDLSSVNYCFLKAICDYLGIVTRIHNSSSFSFLEDKTERLAYLCTQIQATEYISGPAAKSYIQEDIFSSYNIKLTWFDYSGYLEYPQLCGDFVHGVTILDLLFNCGKKSSHYMRYVRP